MKSNLQKIEHVVVLMLENRSFDNLLGWLKHPDDRGGQKVNGVAGKDLKNPIPEYARPADGTSFVSVSVGDPIDMTYPNPDPGEEYAHVNTQLFGSVNPEENRLSQHDAKPLKPYNLPDRMPKTAPMSGFVIDYVNHLNALNEKTPGKGMPSYEEYKIIMDCFPEEAVPVMSALAREYAVFDAWFASVPSQTLCNRSFMHAATSHGYVLNSTLIRWMMHTSPTIFSRIEKKQDPKVTWRIYYDRLDILPLVGLQYPALLKYRRSNLRTMEDFENDASVEGGLPSYSFIEPRFIIDHNDQHPPVKGPTLFRTSSVLAGEQLIERIYNALRNGPDWEKTLFIITFDEHGGCYDHVPPPVAVPPDPKKPKGEQDFKFDRLGVRVPTIMVSPYIKRGTVISEVHDHTSIIKFLCDRWGLKPLTGRDEAAINFHNVLNLKEPDLRKDFMLASRPYRATRGMLDEPINDLQKTILFLLAALEDVLELIEERHLFDKVRDAVELFIDEKRVAHIKTVGQAISFTISVDRRVTKHLSFFDWLKLRVKIALGIAP